MRRLIPLTLVLLTSPPTYHTTMAKLAGPTPGFLKEVEKEFIHNLLHRTYQRIIIHNKLP